MSNLATEPQWAIPGPLAAVIPGPGGLRWQAWCQDGDTIVCVSEAGTISVWTVAAYKAAVAVAAGMTQGALL